MNIYFACSVRGEKTDVNMIKEIVKCLENYGCVLDLITKHLDDKNWINKFNKNDYYIYNYDMDLLKKADVMVADVSKASLGVGYELKTAEIYNIPVCCLIHNDSKNKLSAMIKGNKYFHIYYYWDLEDIIKIIDYFMSVVYKDVE